MLPARVDTDSRHPLAQRKKVLQTDPVIRIDSPLHHHPLSDCRQMFSISRKNSISMTRRIHSQFASQSLAPRPTIFQFPSVHVSPNDEASLQHHILCGISPCTRQGYSRLTVSTGAPGVDTLKTSRSSTKGCRVVARPGTVPSTNLYTVVNV